MELMSLRRRPHRAPRLLLSDEDTRNLGPGSRPSPDHTGTPTLVLTSDFQPLELKEINICCL